MVDVASAKEREQALLGHLAINSNYYQYAVLRALPPDEETMLLSHRYTVNLPAGLVEPRVVGAVGRLIAFPINPDASPELRKLFDETVDSNDELIGDEQEISVVLPTAGVAIQTRLNECDACEPFQIASRKIELEARRAGVHESEALAAQRWAEVDRAKARLKRNPPMLDDPDRSDAAIKVILSNKEDAKD